MMHPARWLGAGLATGNRERRGKRRSSSVNTRRVTSLETSGKTLRRLYREPIDTLETAWQLIPTSAALTLVMFQILCAKRQGALAGLQHQRCTGRQHGEIDQVLLAAGDTLAGNADDLVALALAQLRQVAHREHQQAALGSHRGEPVLVAACQRSWRHHPGTRRQRQQRLAGLVLGLQVLTLDHETIAGIRSD